VGCKELTVKIIKAHRFAAAGFFSSTCKQHQNL
jgi:hypothetical protein